jgi:hypothetical protein
MKRSSEEKSDNWRGLKFRNFWKVDDSDPGSAIIPTNRWGVCVCAPEHRIEIMEMFHLSSFLVLKLVLFFMTVQHHLLSLLYLLTIIILSSRQLNEIIIFINESSSLIEYVLHPEP